MSHFVVLVTGNDIDQALAPFIEQQEEGYEQYFTFNIEYTAAEMLADYEAYENKDDYADVEDYATDYCGFTKDENGDYGYVNNSNAKWDWYQLGGRWTGFFKIKNGTEGQSEKVGTPGLMTAPATGNHVDSALKSQIDFDGMMNDAREKAYAGFKVVATMLLDRPIPQDWNYFRTTYKDDMDVARAKYHAQEVMVELAKNRDIWSISDYLDCSATYQSLKDTGVTLTSAIVDTIHNEYAEYRAKTAFVPFAILHNGEWMERGEMGWWALVSNEKDRDSWNESVLNFIAGLPDDTIINAVDCHI